MNNLNMYKLRVIFIYEKNRNNIYLTIRDIEYQTADALQNGKKWSNPNNFEHLGRIPDTH